MNFNSLIELEKIILNLGDFNQQRESQVEFIKESIMNGEYLINPRVIASRWLNSCFQVQAESCSSDFV